MRLPLILFGVLTVLAGIIPYLKDVTFLSFLASVPSEGPIYQIIIIVLGALAILIGMKMKQK